MIFPLPAFYSRFLSVRQQMLQLLISLSLSLAASLTISGAASAGAAREAVLSAAMNSVLVVRSADSEDRFLGSAFLWGEEARVAVTNAHVLGSAEEVRLVDHLGREELAYVIARDSLRDVAVIALGPGADGLPRQGLVPAAEPALLGQAVYALGAPLGAAFTLTEGLVSAPARQVEPAVPLHMLQHDAAVNPGSSGGPLVDAEGQLLGMNSRIADGSRMFVGIAYAIAAGDLSRIVEGLIDETLLPFPKLGLTVRPLDRKLAEVLGRDPGGLLIDHVSEGGLAAAAGLRPGDILLTVNAARLSESGSLAYALEAALPAGEAMIGLVRGGEEMALRLALSPAADEAGLLGLRLRDLPSEAAAPARTRSYRLGALGLILGQEGRIKALTANAPAARAGLARGERILAVNGDYLEDEALAALEISAPVLLLVEMPGGMTRHVWLDPWGASDAAKPAGGANVLDQAVIVF